MSDDDTCPDGDTHDADDCHRYGCQNYRDEIEAGAPWGSSPNQLKEWAQG